MLKKLILVFAIVLSAVGCQLLADSRFTTGTGTAAVTMDTLEVNLFKSHALTTLGYNFKITQADTLRDDSITVTIQTSRDMVTWLDLFSFATLGDADTATIAFWWNTDDTLKAYVGNGKPWQSYMQTQIIFHDSTAQVDSETIRPTSDVYDTLDWNYSTGSTRYGVIDEASLDTADYIYVKGEDSTCIVGWGDHASTEWIVDSLKLKCVAFWWDSACSMKMGFAIGDTSLDHIDSLTSIFGDNFAITDSPTTYNYISATDPYGESWDVFEVDSITGAFQSVWVDTMGDGTKGQIRVAQAWIEVFYTKGSLSPDFEWRMDMIIRE